MKSILPISLLLASCVVEPLATSTVQSNLCTAQDQNEGLCVPFTLAGLRAASRQYATESYPTNLGVTLTCDAWNPMMSNSCDITIDIGFFVISAGCTIWSETEIVCDVY